MLNVNNLSYECFLYNTHVHILKQQLKNLLNVILCIIVLHVNDIFL